MATATNKEERPLRYIDCTIIRGRLSTESCEKRAGEPKLLSCAGCKGWVSHGFIPLTEEQTEAYHKEAAAHSIEAAKLHKTILKPQQYYRNS